MENETVSQGFIELTGKRALDKALYSWIHSQIYRQEHLGAKLTKEEKEERYVDGLKQVNKDLITKVQYKRANTNPDDINGLYKLTLKCETPILSGARKYEMHSINLELTFNPRNTFHSTKFVWENNYKSIVHHSTQSFHPHISVIGEPCLGNYDQPWYFTLSESTLSHFVGVANSFLGNWTRNDAYWDINVANNHYKDYKKVMFRAGDELSGFMPLSRVRKIKKINNISYRDFLMHEANLSAHLDKINGTRGIKYDMINMEGQAYRMYVDKMIKITTYSQRYIDFIREYRDFFVWQNNNNRETDLYSKIQKVTQTFRYMGFPKCIEDEKDTVGSYLHQDNGPSSHGMRTLNRNCYITYTGLNSATGSNLSISRTSRYSAIWYMSAYSRNQERMDWRIVTDESMSNFRTNTIVVNDKAPTKLEMWRYMINTVVNPTDTIDSSCIPSEDQDYYASRYQDSENTINNNTKGCCREGSQAQLGIIGDGTVQDFMNGDLDQKYLYMSVISMGLTNCAYPIALKWKYYNQIGFLPKLNDSIRLVRISLIKDSSITGIDEINWAVVIKKEVLEELYVFIEQFSNDTRELMLDKIRYVNATLSNVLTSEIIIKLNKLTRKHNEKAIKNNKIIESNTRANVNENSIDISAYNLTSDEGQGSLFIE